MANVGLRAGGLRGPLLQSVASTLHVARPAAVRRPIQRALAPAMLASVRHHSQPREEHFVANEFGLLSDFTPVPWSERPSLLTKEGLVSVKDHAVEGLRGVFSLLTMKWYLSGWKGADFAVQAEELYGSMNEAFARGDLKALSTICFPNMYANLKNDIKKRRVNFDWRKVTTVSPPRIVQVRCGRLTSEFAVGQVVVRIDQEQAVTPLAKKSGGAAAAGKNAPRPVHVREYVVFQRVVSDPASPWCIYGKLNVPKWEAAQQ